MNTGDGDVVQGLVAVVAVVCGLMLVMVPFMWCFMHFLVPSVAGDAACLDDWRGAIRKAHVSEKGTTIVDYAFEGLDATALQEYNLTDALTKVVQSSLASVVSGDVAADQVLVEIMAVGGGAAAGPVGTITRCTLQGSRRQRLNELASAREDLQSTLETQMRSKVRAAGEKAETAAIKHHFKVMGNDAVITPDPKDVGKYFDANADGIITRDEFVEGMEQTSYPGGPQIDAAFDGLDSDHDGQLSFAELEDAMATSLKTTDCWPLAVTQQLSAGWTPDETTTVATTMVAATTVASTSPNMRGSTTVAESEPSPVVVQDRDETTTTVTTTKTMQMRGSAITPAEFRKAIDEAGILPEATTKEYQVAGLCAEPLQANKAERDQIAYNVRSVVFDGLSGSVPKSKIHVEFEKGGQNDVTIIRCIFLEHKKSHVAQLSALEGQIDKMLGDDISSRLNGAILVGEKAPSPLCGTIKVTGGALGHKVYLNALGDVFDVNGNGKITKDEFSTVSLKMPILDDAKVHAAFAGLDVDFDEVLDPKLVTDTLVQAGKDPSTDWPRNSVTSTTVTPTTQTTTSTPDQLPAVVAVTMVAKSIKFSDAEDAWKKTMSSVFRDELAAMLGIASHKDEIMDTTGQARCVSAWTTEDGQLAFTGCTAMPDQARLNDIKEVVRGAQQVVGDSLSTQAASVEAQAAVSFDKGSIEFSVVGLPSCSSRRPDEPKHTADASYCLDPPTVAPATPAPTAPTPAPAVATTTANRAVASPEPAKKPAEMPSFGKFLQQLGNKAPCNSPEAFALIDSNGDGSAPLSELATVASRLGYDMSVVDPLWSYLDRNDDGKVESAEFAAACQKATKIPEGAISLSTYRERLGHTFGWRKVGVGVCRTATEAYPECQMHHNVATMEDCRAKCSASQTCQAYAFKLGGTCRIYSGKKEYTGTTAIMDVECFSKVVTTEAQFDKVKVNIKFIGVDMEGLTPEQKIAIGQGAAAVLASEVPVGVTMVTSPASGAPGRCSVFPGAQQSSADSQVVCELSLGERIKEIQAKYGTERLKQLLSAKLAPMPGMRSVGAQSIQVVVAGSSEKFREADVDNSGSVDQEEFVRLAAKIQLSSAETFAKDAQFAFEGLDWNADGVLSPDEFEADGLTQWSTGPLG